MKPAPFGYDRPRDLCAALSMLAASNGSAKIIAGGQSLGPMLNLRLVQPDLLVDITAIAELKRIEEKPDALFIGACVTHADIEGATRGLADFKTRSQHGKQAVGQRNPSTGLCGVQAVKVAFRPPGGHLFVDFAHGVGHRLAGAVDIEIR